MVRRLFALFVLGGLLFGFAPSAWAQEVEEDVAPAQSPVVLPLVVEPEPQPAPPPPEVKGVELALTGSDVLLPLLVATGLVLAGSFVVVSTRRRRAALVLNEARL